MTWARKVRPDKIRQLYSTDARGVLDHDLIDEVGYAMYARCQSIIDATEAGQGRVFCPACRTVLHRGRNAEIRCDCGWETTWPVYRASYRGKQLHATNARPAFEQFIDRWPRARSPGDKLLLIDRLIHAIHENASNPSYARPAAVNLIEGKASELVALLDELAYSDLSVGGSARGRWKEQMDVSKQHWSPSGRPHRRA